MQFKRSLVGYNAVQVENAINAKNEEFAITKDQLLQELAALNANIDELKLKINELEKNDTNEKAVLDQMAKELISAHLAATEKVYQSILQSEKMGQQTRELVVQREKDQEDLYETIRHLTDDIKSVTQGLGGADREKQ